MGMDDYRPRQIIFKSQYDRFGRIAENKNRELSQASLSSDSCNSESKKSLTPDRRFRSRNFKSRSRFNSGVSAEEEKKSSNPSEYAPKPMRILSNGSSGEVPKVRFSDQLIMPVRRISMEHNPELRHYIHRLNGMQKTISEGKNLHNKLHCQLNFQEGKESHQKVLEQMILKTKRDELVQLENKVKQWHEKKESDVQIAANCIEEEHKNIIDEMSKLDKLSDCSVEIP